VCAWCVLSQCCVAMHWSSSKCRVDFSQCGNMYLSLYAPVSQVVNCTIAQYSLLCQLICLLISCLCTGWHLWSSRINTLKWTRGMGSENATIGIWQSYRAQSHITFHQITVKLSYLYSFHNYTFTVINKLTFIFLINTLLITYIAIVWYIGADIYTLLGLFDIYIYVYK
jgi:hypothetical protein